MTQAPAPRILIHLLRRDLRLADNPILSEVSRLSSQPQAPFTHLLPVYVFPAQQIEVSGFLQNPEAESPYPEARSQVGGFWRCGPHRAKFMTESVWDLKQGLQRVNSGLEIRVGMLGDVVRQILEWYKSVGEDGEGGVGVPGDGKPEEPKGEVTRVWMTSDDGTEEKREERDVRRVVESEGIEFRLWKDEKYFIDECVVALTRTARVYTDLPYYQPRSSILGHQGSSRRIYNIPQITGAAARQAPLASRHTELLATTTSTDSATGCALLRTNYLG